MLKLIHPIAKPHPQFSIGMLGKHGRINRSHARLGDVAQEDGIQPTVYSNGDGSLMFGTVHTRPVIAPIGGRADGIDEGKLEQAIAVKGFAIARYLASIIEHRRNSLSCEQKKKLSKNP